MEPIGLIRTPFRQKFAIPRQGSLVPAARGEVFLDGQKVSDGCLDGLAGFSHIWLVFQFHQSSGSKKGKIAAPRLDGETIGVFACRSPHRPNPIGMTLCRLDEVFPEQKKLRVSGIDLIDKTPILDIKPYIAYADRPEKWHEGWSQDKASGQTTVKFSKEFEAKALELGISSEVLDLFKQCLSHDPRPRSQKDKKKQFATQIQDWDVHFRVDDNQVLVTDIIVLG